MDNTVANTFWIIVYCFGWWLLIAAPLFLALAFFIWVGCKLERLSSTRETDLLVEGVEEHERKD